MTEYEAAWICFISFCVIMVWASAIIDLVADKRKEKQEEKRL